MIDLYDGNNVMFRATERQQMPGHERLSLRQRFEHAASSPQGSQIWVWDGAQHNERRRAIYPQYKMHRPPKPENLYAQIKLWKELLGHSPALQVEVFGWEADDVISTLARKFASRGVPVRIHTNDMDYAQLTNLPNVMLHGVNTKEVNARWVPLYKAMVGDTSDNIDGIPNFGHKRWLAMEDHWPQIERAIVAGDPAGFVELPFTKGVLAWLQSNENIKLLQAMLTVTYFEDVPDDELEGGLKEGVLNRVAAHSRMSEFFL